MLQRQPGVSIVGMGCSSFSNFFDGGNDGGGGGGGGSSEHAPTSPDGPDNDDEGDESSGDRGLHVDGVMLDAASSLSPSHPRVRQWIDAVHYAVLEAGITVLDTAPWYGHGISETVVGWALESILVDDDDTGDSNNPNEKTNNHSRKSIRRSDLTINTKVGRYEANPEHQFDYSHQMTLASIQRSLQRMQITYVDVLQLHDPEFAPSLDQLVDETIPALLQIQKKGWCRRLGMTGYPIHVQRQILDRTLEVFKRNLWDQSLVYCHYNLHDTSLFYPPGRNQDDDVVDETTSFAEYCRDRGIHLMTAAPLSMGLLTAAGPPQWHPASENLKEACREAAAMCSRRGVDVSELAVLFAMCHPTATCTILGMKDVAQVRAAQQAASRIAQAVASPAEGEEVSDLSPHETTLRHVLTESEWDAYRALRDPDKGPFARVWKDGTYQWDGVQCARDFWKHQLGIDQEPWQATMNDSIR